MKKLSILAFAIVVAVGCGKKKEDPAAESKTTEMGKDNPKPSTPETATNPGDDKKTDTPAAPPVGGEVEAVADLPAGLPKDCVDAHAAMVKMSGCDKIAPDVKAPMIKAWNLAVKGSFEPYSTGTDAQKETIRGSCESMVKSTSNFLKDCP